MQDPTESTNGTHPFKAEIQQLLDLVVHSLYTDREIFLRELISNGSDAMEKLRHLEATEKEIHGHDLPLELTISADKEAGILEITDHGLGMTRGELAENLGTIAHSGTKNFLKAVKESGGQACAMIGQFGVGFYSAFMVADSVQVFTRSWHPAGESLVWTTDGTRGYTIETSAEPVPRGCRIVLKLKEEYKKFAETWQIRGLISKFSNFVGFPILVEGERVNKIEAVWLKNKNEITEEEYTAFYHFIGHQAEGSEPPAYRLHFSADAPLAINALVFVPAENPERLGFGQVDPGVALYCRKVLIDQKPKELLPEWMRFLKGVIDSEDLPLNISRETMQDSALVRKLRDVISKRVLKMLEAEATADPEKYNAFHRKFERFLKEGVAMDYTHRDALAKLLRFESSATEPGVLTSFTEYRQRAKDGQDDIYYLIGANRESIESSPYIEAFKARGLEVIYFTDGVDIYVVEALHAFDGKNLVSIDRAGLDVAGDVPEEGEALSPDQTTALCEFLKETAGDRVTKVAAGKRLVDSPVVALLPEDTMTPQMRRMMKAMDENFKDDAKVELEINPRHPLIRGLSKASGENPDLARLVALQLLDNALLAAGLLEDARPTVVRMTEIMEKALG